MNAAECARAASDLTTLVTRLDRTRRALVGQSRLAEEEFGGLSGDAYRRHVAGSAVTVAEAGSVLALLAGALAALGRELAAAEEIRDQAAGSPPERARELRAGALDVERRAQARWRAAIATYEGRPSPVQQSSDPPVVPGAVLNPTVPSPADAAVPTVTSSVPDVPTPAVSDPAVPSPPPADVTPEPPEPELESALVVPPPRLESELVVPASPAHCGTPEVVDGLR